MSQFHERLAAGADRLWALPYFVRPTSIKSTSTVSGKEEQHGRLSETGTWDSQIPFTALTVANIRIKYTGLALAVLGTRSSVEPRHVISDPLKSFSQCFPFTIEHCMQLPIAVFSFAKTLTT